MESVRSEGSDQDSRTSMTSVYDVFLSFRGPDTRLGFVDHLYERLTGVGLHVFKDDEEIRHGEVIGGELERAIVGSRVYAIVFSRNYASSVWCLRELNLMIDLHGGSKVGRKIILPIFYGADPADVKLRTELYREALDAHKGRHGHDLVKKWEETLKTVGQISGWESKAMPGEGRFVRSIVQDILGKLRIKDLSLPLHITGIDDGVSNISNLLDCNSMGVRIVVLHGMGGIGKTTLARVIFNKLYSLFEGSSFISNVRELSTSHGGIAKLQNKLSRDILGDQHVTSCNYDDEFGEIIPRFQGKRMLLIFDDVDELSQLYKLVGNNPEDALGVGSRLIITTRDKSICNGFIRSGSNVLRFYEMQKMTDNHALQLFSRRAFGTDEPPQDHLSLSKMVVETTGNLPLALEVIAGHLCCQSKESWKHTLEKLENVPLKKVFEILKVSYEGLDFREREIFLDIACFQGHMPRRYAGYLWEARKLFPECGVMVLINKSLVKINSKGEFWIHDQLRDMGREIVRSEGLGRPERCSRLWDRGDALETVHKKLVSDKIIAINLGHCCSELSGENFRGLSNLLYLNLYYVNLTGDFGDLQDRLMWFSLIGCKHQLNSDFFKMSNLVVLQISLWRGVEKLIMPKLRALDIRHSSMKTTPDVSSCLKLEMMSFYLFYMEEIHHSVGKLENLTYMKISSCWSLRSLPKELCCARALRELIVTDTGIEEVPETIGRLESLRTLNIRKNKIKRLPASIRDMRNLLVLIVGSNPLDVGILEEIGSLSALEYLDLSYSGIRFLPGTVSQLSSLKSLKLNSCKNLQELRGLPTNLTLLEAEGCPLDKGNPEEIGSLTALESLDLSFCKIRFLPATMSRLSSLKSLKLHSCSKLQELRGLPTNLTLLDAWCCPLDKGIPEEIGSLTALESLNLSFCKIRFLPATMSRLSSLKSLKLHSCSKLQELTGLPTSLTLLEAGGCPLDKGNPGEIGSLTALESLDLSFCKIRFLPVTMSRFSSLKSLKLHSCSKLEELPELPTSLTMLTFSSKSLRAAPNLAVLTNITELVLSDGRDYEGEFFEESEGRDCTKDYEGECVELSGLGSLDKLKRLHLCPSRMITFSQASELGCLSRLETLDLSFPDMSSVSELPSSLVKLTLWHSRTTIPWESYSNLMLLTKLRLVNSTLTDIELGGLDLLPSLRKLSIGESDSLVRVSNLGRLRGLKSLKFSRCRALVEIPGLEQLELLERLSIHKCGSICGIQDLLGVKRLRRAEVHYCSSWLRMPRVTDECFLSIRSCGEFPSFLGTYGGYERRKDQGRPAKFNWEMFPGNEGSNELCHVDLP